MIKIFKMRLKSNLVALCILNFNNSTAIVVDCTNIKDKISLFNIEDIESQYRTNMLNRDILVNITKPIAKKASDDDDKTSINVGVGDVFNFANVKNFENLTTYSPLSEADINGSDVELIKIYANHINKSINWYYIFKDEDNPFLYKEFIKLIENGSLDFAVGAIFRIYGDTVEYSGIYNKMSAFWVYSVMRDRRSWLILAGKVDGLYIFFMFYVFYSFLRYYFSKYDCNDNALGDIFITSWGALVGCSALIEGRTKKQNILLIVYMYMCIHFSAYISVQMYSFLTIQDPPELLKTNEDIENSGRQIFLRVVAKEFIHDKEYLSFIKNSFNCEEFHDCLFKSIEHNGLTVVTDGFYKSVQTMTSVNNEARLLRADENIITVYHEMIVRKDSPYVKSFQKVVTRLFEAGICDYLLRVAIGINVYEKAEIITKNTVANSYGCEEGCAITLHQTAGAFYVWIAGCGASALVFVLECYNGKKKMSFDSMTIQNIQ